MTRFPSEHLHTFAAVLAEGTLEAAARSLHITPSAVSQRLKSMEQTAGRVLLQRSNPVKPTDAGTVVLRLARQVSQLESDASRELGLGVTSADLPVVSLPIVVNADSLAVWFLQALARVPRELKVTFDLHRDDEHHSASLLRAGAVMAAVTATPEAVQGCRVESLGVMRYRAVATPEFIGLWLPGGPDPENLRRAPAVDFDRKDEYQRRFLTGIPGAAGAQEAVHPAGPRHFIPSSREYADAIRLGLGWGLLPEAQCRQDLHTGRLRELAPQQPFDVPLYWQRWRMPSPVLDQLSEAVRATAAEFLLPNPPGRITDQGAD